MTRQFDCFNWDRGNTAKFQKHRLSAATIEGLVTRPLALIPNESHSHKERRFRAIGRTDSGRAVFIEFTLRRKGDVQFFRPISARAAAAFIDKEDLSQYDLSGAQFVRFEMGPKDKSIRACQKNFIGR